MLSFHKSHSLTSVFSRNFHSGNGVLVFPMRMLPSKPLSILRLHPIPANALNPRNTLF
ncbi:MAG: hypothetical protein KatS3mg029_0496 [Saprospiraceae bacterium]|nr:MAG: hypothetical protein KatS3mg029_0496 [Saprospiraceae bacterium]